MEVGSGGPSAHNRSQIPGRQIRAKIAVVGSLSARVCTHFARRETEARKKHMVVHVHWKVRYVLADSTAQCQRRQGKLRDRRAVA